MLAADLAIDVDDIQARNPRIVYALGTGQGSLGPEAEDGGFDLASAWAGVGAAFQMTPTGGEPPNQPGSFGDLSGGMNLAGAVAAALYRRQRDGHAPVVEVSLYATGMWWMAQAITAGAVGVIEGVPHPHEPVQRAWSITSRPVMVDGSAWCSSKRTAGGRTCAGTWAAPTSSTTRGSQRLRHGNSHVEECTEVLDEIFVTRTLAEWREALADPRGGVGSGAEPGRGWRGSAGHRQRLPPGVDKGDGRVYRGVASPVRFDGVAIGPLDRRARARAAHRGGPAGARFRLGRHCRGSKTKAVM